MNLIPKIPSCIELIILDYSGYCPICKKFVNHNLVNCVDCDSILCLNYSGGIYTLKDKRYICKKCRINKINKSKPVTFYFNPSLLTVKD